MRPLFTIIVLNLVLIPLFWLLPTVYRIHIYTITAIADAVSYLVLTVLFFIRLRRSGKEAEPGMTLHFVFLQLLLLFSLFLFKLSGFLLLKHCI